MTEGGCASTLLTFLIVLWLSAVSGCSSNDPTITITIESTEANRPAVVELVTEFAKTYELSKTVAYETLDASRDAFVVTFRSPSGDETVMLLDGLQSDGTILLHIYDGPVALGSTTRDAIYTGLVPALREVATIIGIDDTERRESDKRD